MAPSSPSERAAFSSPSETPPQYERPEYAVPHYDAPHEAPLPPESPRRGHWQRAHSAPARAHHLRALLPPEQHHKVLEMGRGCNILWAVLSPRKEQ